MYRLVQVRQNLKKSKARPELITRGKDLPALLSVTQSFVDKANRQMNKQFTKFLKKDFILHSHD